jgi:hypothetical protein
MLPWPKPAPRQRSAPANPFPRREPPRRVFGGTPNDQEAATSWGAKRIMQQCESVNGISGCCSTPALRKTPGALTFRLQTRTFQRL